jgi:hypothetical protein
MQAILASFVHTSDFVHIQSCPGGEVGIKYVQDICDVTIEVFNIDICHSRGIASTLMVFSRLEI